MKVVILSREYPHETGWGGVGTYTYYLAQGLVELGVKVDVISGSVGHNRTYSENGVTIYRVPRYRSISHFYSTTTRIYAGVYAYRTLRKILKDHSVDVLEGPEVGGDSSIYSLLKLPLLKHFFSTEIPLVVKLHTPFYLIAKLNYKTGIDVSIASSLEILSIKKADILTAPSHDIAKRVLSDLNLKRDIKVIPNGINLGEIDALSEGETLSLGIDVNKDENIVLFIGRMEWLKGPQILFKAIPLVLKEYPKTKFIFVGKDVPSGPFKGSVKNWMIKEATKKGIINNLIFMDHIQRNKVFGLLKMCDVFVVPSLYESFSYTCLEAMACSKAVVASEVGGIKEVIDSLESGILFPPNDDEKLAEAIIRLLEDEELRGKFGHKARKKVERCYDYRKIAKQTLELYDSLTG